jgi:hypothetical protein
MNYQTLTVADLREKDKEGISLFANLILDGKLDQVPIDILCAIPMDETGWLAPQGKYISNIFYALVWDEDFKKIPTQIVRKVPMNKAGWLLERGDLPLLSALIGRNFDHVFNRDVFPPHDPQTLTNLRIALDYLKVAKPTAVPEIFLPNLIRCQQVVKSLLAEAEFFQRKRQPKFNID